jgi:hypothetical protein
MAGKLLRKVSTVCNVLDFSYSFYETIRSGPEFLLDALTTYDGRVLSEQKVLLLTGEE